MRQLRMFAEASLMDGTYAREDRYGTEHARSIVVRVDASTWTLTGTPQPSVATELDKPWEPNSVYAPGSSDKVKWPLSSVLVCAATFACDICDRST